MAEGPASDARPETLREPRAEQQFSSLQLPLANLFRKHLTSERLVPKVPVQQQQPAWAKVLLPLVEANARSFDRREDQFELWKEQ